MLCARHTPLAMAALAASVLVVPVALPREARACGGFFCNASAPVNQAAERIIFAHGSDGMFTAVIQIQYRGPAEQFSWVLPVPGIPEIGVSSDLAFDRLVARTNPTYTLRRRVEGECRRETFGDLGYADSVFADSGARDADSGADDAGTFVPPVVVLDHGNVGPYDYDVIGVEPTSEDPAGAAFRWLERNGYDVGALAPDILRSYLEDGMNLVAFRLSKDDSSGTVRPVTLRYADECPSIPIRPTAVAATRDMGVLVWILGESRAIPSNYFDLELNEAYINWFSPASSYDRLVTMAADDAGGHGFVTELAGSADLLQGAIVTWAEEQAWSRFLDDLPDLDDAELIGQSALRWSAWDGFQDALAASLVPPGGRTLAEVVQCLVCDAAATGGAPARAPSTPGPPRMP
jgi:hypothetical protein